MILKMILNGHLKGIWHMSGAGRREPDVRGLCCTSDVKVLKFDVLNRCGTAQGRPAFLPLFIGKRPGRIHE